MAAFSFPWSQEPQPGLSPARSGASGSAGKLGHSCKIILLWSEYVFHGSEIVSVRLCPGSSAGLQPEFPGDFCFFFFFLPKAYLFPSVGMWGADHILKSLAGGLKCVSSAERFWRRALIKTSWSVLTWVMQTEEHWVRRPPHPQFCHLTGWVIWGSSLWLSVFLSENLGS